MTLSSSININYSLMENSGMMASQAAVERELQLKIKQMCSDLEAVALILSTVNQIITIQTINNKITSLDLAPTQLEHLKLNRMQQTITRSFTRSKIRSYSLKSKSTCSCLKMSVSLMQGSS